MFLMIEIDDEAIMTEVINQIALQNTGRTIAINPPLDTEEDLFKHDVLYTSYPQVDTSDVAVLRYTDLYLSSLGARYWGFDTYKSFPSYGGPKPETKPEIKQIIVDALYTRGRAELFKSYEVNYLGRVFSDPRNILVLDNKKGPHMHHPKNSEDMDKLLSSVTDDWWHDLGVVSSGNVIKLEKFLYQIDYANPLATSNGARAKLNFCGREFTDISLPNEKNDSEYGIALREQTRPLDV